MKYMHFNSSCSYTALAMLLEEKGISTEDTDIALEKAQKSHAFKDQTFRRLQSLHLKGIALYTGKGRGGTEDISCHTDGEIELIPVGVNLLCLRTDGEAAEGKNQIVSPSSKRLI